MAASSIDSTTTRRQLALHYHELATAELLSPAERLVWDAARTATDHSYAPYSHFHVGAALLLEDGSLVQGTNQENAAYPSGLCAERTALFGLGGRPGPMPRIVGMSVAGRPATGDFTPALPCGACRQVMLEYEMRQGQPIWLLLPSLSGTVLRFERLADLLPFHFSPGDLPPRL
jgi:cytidine deaminase